LTRLLADRTPTDSLGLRDCFYTFSTRSDVISKRSITCLAPRRDRATVQDFSRRFLL
ncbi:hypothetical protein AVEN_215077-1, partial [Araneus ventricosus]